MTDAEIYAMIEEMSRQALMKSADALERDNASLIETIRICQAQVEHLIRERDALKANK